MRKALKVFSVLYWIATGFFALFAILTFASGNLLTEIQKAFPVELNGVDPKVVFGILFIILAVIYAVIAVSMRNVATKKSKGTVALVLLALSAIGNIYSVITAFSISTLISLVIAVMLLYFVVCVRNENEGKN